MQNSFLQTKKVIYPSKDPTHIPEFAQESKVTFDYEVRLIEQNDQSSEEPQAPVSVKPGHVIDDTRKHYPDGYGKPLELVLGKKFKIPAWEICLRTMRIGEVASFVLQPLDMLEYPYVSQQLRNIAKQENSGGNSSDEGAHSHMCGGMAAVHGLGYADLDELLKTPQPLMVTFELLSVLPPDGYEHDRWQLSERSKRESIPVLQDQGNTAFRKGDYASACTAYGEALTRLESLTLMEKPGEPEFIELEQKTIPIYLNIAQCKLRLEEYYAAIQAVDNVFSKCEGQWREKALFRRAKAHAGAWNFEEARRDFQNLMTDFPDTASLVAKELQNLAVSEKQKNMESNMYRNVFN